MSTSESFDAMVTLTVHLPHGGRPRTRGGLELDITCHRHDIRWRPAEVRAAKRRINRRDRRRWRQHQHGALRAARTRQPS